MRKIMLAVLALMLPASAQAVDAPRVLASIKPIHGLVAAVMNGVAEPGLIVTGSQSPHGYAMKPSDMRALEKAQLVVWVGPGFETWLSSPLARSKSTLAMQDVPGQTRLATREGGVWDSHEEHDDHDHGHDEADGHLWLDADNSIRLVNAVAARLGEMDPAHAALYAGNAARTVERIAKLDSDLATRLAPLAKRPYVVFHDAHQYFERRYGLSPAGAITVDPDRQPGPRRLAALRDRLKVSGATCIFREPRFAGPAIAALAKATGARIGQLDPEGALIEPGPDAYTQLMEGLAKGLADCLSAP